MKSGKKAAAPLSNKPRPSEISWYHGRNDGLNQGQEHGYMHGRCEAVNKLTPQEPIRIWDIKVLFVATGRQHPYIPIDQGVADAILSSVREYRMTTPQEDVAAIADQMQPDLIVVLDALHSFPYVKVDELRAKGFRTAVWFTDDPYYTDMTVDIAPHYDYVFTLELNCIELYQSLGCANVFHLPFGIDPRVYRPRRVELAQRTEICFIGTAFANRVAFFERLVPYLATKQTMIAGYWWDRLPNYQSLQDKIRLGVWMDAEETSAYYFGSRIVINMHRYFDDDSYNMNNRRTQALSVNPRTFEINGSGAFQLTDMRNDLPQFYTPGNNIAVYEGPDDLINKIEYYLSHEDERREIAIRGYEHTLRNHTYRNRISQMLQIIFP